MTLSNWDTLAANKAVAGKSPAGVAMESKQSRRAMNRNEWQVVVA